MDKKKLLGKRLKELIKQKNISQEKLAELIGVEPTTLSNIVTGRNYPLMSTLEKILEVLDSDFSEAFNFEHHNDNEDLKEAIEQILNNNPERMKDFYKIAKALVE
jgi:transcriptional regulator, XRE family